MVPLLHMCIHNNDTHVVMTMTHVLVMRMTHFWATTYVVMAVTHM